jgi:hypothetical protein
MLTLLASFATALAQLFFFRPNSLAAITQRFSFGSS